MYHFSFSAKFYVQAIKKSLIIFFLQISGSGRNYLCLKKSYLQLTGQLLNEDGTTIPDYSDLDVEEVLNELETLHITPEIADQRENAPIPADSDVSCVNNLLHSLFSQIDCSLNDELITSSSGLYPYTAYLQSLLCVNKTNNAIKDQAALFIKDTASQMDDPMLRGWNLGLFKRGQYLRKSRVFDLCGPLHLDIGNANKHILNGVSVKLSLWRSRPDFYIIRPKVKQGSGPAGVPVANTRRFMIKILSATYHVCQVQPNPAMYLAHERLLKKSKLALYSYYKSECRKCQIPAGSYSFELADVYQGRAPVKLYMGLTYAANSSGDMALNPFQFINANLTSMVCTLEGKAVEGSIMNMKYGDTCQESNFVQAYYSLFKNDENVEKNCAISRAEYFSGYNIYCFQVQSDVRTESGDVFPSPKVGNFCVNMTFGQATPEPLSLIMLAYFPDIIKMDGARNVYTKVKLDK